MKSYALPLVILVVIAGLVGLIIAGSTGGSPYSSGDPNANLRPEWTRGTGSKVELVEYSDFQCPACRSYEGMLRQLITERGSMLKFTYRHFPLFQIHNNADITARAAEAAGKQGKFWEMHDLLFDRQTDWAEKLNSESLMKEYAKELGLNEAQFASDLDSDFVKEVVAADYARGMQLGINATPTFFVNGVKIQNPRSYQEFLAIIDTAAK